MTIQQMFFAGGGALPFFFTISANTTNVNLRTAAIAAGWNQTSALTCTINSGVVVFSTSTGSYAMTVNGSFPGGVSLINNGTILGKGGDGGNGDYNAGTSAGPALLVQSAVTVTNASGRIAGGGGGGGGGSSYTYCASQSKSFCAAYATDYGSGGGGGIGNGTAGSGNTNGTAGTLTAPGSGGYPSGSGQANYVGAGGAGGGYGSAGGNGCSGNYGGGCGAVAGSGGAAGAAIVGNSNITYISTGTRNGAIS